MSVVCGCSSARSRSGSLAVTLGVGPATGAGRTRPGRGGSSVCARRRPDAVWSRSWPHIWSARASRGRCGGWPRSPRGWMRGDLHPRIHDVGSRRDEVRVLADSFNHMLDRLTEAFAGQRAFVADASHELRTPLTVIKGQLEVLAAQANPSAAEVRRVEALVQAEVGTYQPIGRRLAAAGALEQTRLSDPRRSTLTVFVKELWEATRLTRRSDASSSARFPPAGCRPTPTVCSGVAQPARATPSRTPHPMIGRIRLTVCRQAGMKCVLSLRMTVRAFPEDQRELVFERFHRTDAARTRARGGTGLGLAIVRAIAVAHSGAVSASTSPLGGARVELCLPGFDARAESRLEVKEGHIA